MSDLTIPTSLTTSQPLAERPPNRPPTRFLGTPMAAATEDETANEIRKQHPLSGTFSSKKEDALLYDPDIAKEVFSFSFSDPEKTKEDYHQQFASKITELKKFLTEKEPAELMSMLCRLEGDVERGSSHDKKDKKEQEEYFSEIRETTDALLNMECSEPTRETIVELVGLSFAVEIMDAASYYKNSFIDEEVRRGILSDPGMTDQATSRVQKNLEQFETAAQSVIELVKQRNGYSQKSKRNIPEEEKELWGKCREYTKLAIDGYLSFARAVKADNLDQARIEKAKAKVQPQAMARTLAAFYSSKLTQALAAGDQSGVNNFARTARAAWDAVIYFEKAAVQGINKEEEKAWILAGFYKLQEAEAAAAENDSGSKKFWWAAFSAQNAAAIFNKAALQGISTEEKNALILAGSYELQKAEATAAGDQLNANKFAAVANATKKAVEYFKEAALQGISAKEKNAWTLAGSYRLQEAASIAAEDEPSADKFSRAAQAADNASRYFREVAIIAREGKKQKEALEIDNSYKLREAEAIIAGDQSNADKFNHAAQVAWIANFFFGRASVKGISEQEQDAWILTGSYRLQEAKTIAAGDQSNVNRFSRAAEDANEAANIFNGIALGKVERNLYEMGLYYLKRAALWKNKPEKAEHFSYEDAQAEIRTEQVVQTQARNEKWDSLNQQPGRTIVWKGLPGGF